MALRPLARRDASGTAPGGRSASRRLAPTMATAPATKSSSRPKSSPVRKGAMGRVILAAAGTGTERVPSPDEPSTGHADLPGAGPHEPQAARVEVGVVTTRARLVGAGRRIRPVARNGEWNDRNVRDAVVEGAHVDARDSRDDVWRLDGDDEVVGAGRAFLHHRRHPHVRTCEASPERHGNAQGSREPTLHRCTRASHRPQARPPASESTAKGRDSAIPSTTWNVVSSMKA